MNLPNENLILQELKELSSKGKIKSINLAPNAVGLTFKKAMGINHTNYIQNRYKGFTLRASTNDDKGNSLVNLFAKVANWKKSECKSSSEILEKYLRDCLQWSAMTSLQNAFRAPVQVWYERSQE